jgi:ribosomal protein L12E/L44/L45/RPP1/RPP2
MGKFGEVCDEFDSLDSVTLTFRRASCIIGFIIVDSANQVWAETFAKAVEGKNLKEILFAFGASGPATGGAAAAAGGAAPAAGEAAPAEEAAAEEEESDEDMGMGLFD